MKAALSQFGPVVVAGGAVRDHLMGRAPKDYDIFVLGSTWDDTLVERVRTALSPFEPITTLEFHKSEPYLVTTVRHKGEMVQVMLNPAPTVSALVDTFDWNVCLFAYDGDTVTARTNIEEIGEGYELKLQACRFPLSTLRRGFRFSERFGMTLKRETVVDLCQRIVTGPAVGSVANEPDMPSLAANVLVTA